MKIRLPKFGVGKSEKDNINFERLIEESKKAVGIKEYVPIAGLSDYEYVPVLTNCFFRLVNGYTEAKLMELAIEDIVRTLRTMKEIYKIPPIPADVINYTFDRSLKYAVLTPTGEAPSEIFKYIVGENYEPVKKLLRDS